MGDPYFMHDAKAPQDHANLKQKKLFKSNAVNGFLLIKIVGRKNVSGEYFLSYRMKAVLCDGSLPGLYLLTMTHEALNMNGSIFS